ncbi:MAG: hypothetical protein NTY56_02830 [Patescibacteria group bacterium]|nr:hypothetical protein [Patescibacteria group bacterium]
MKKITQILCVLAYFVLLVGCASITGTTGQSVSVETRDKEKLISGASCELANSRGKWFVNSPGSAQIRRSNDDLIVLCTKTGIEPGRASVVSDTKGMMFGNILLGGGIGAVIDHNTGAAYEYPSLIQIMMGAEVKVQTDPNDPTKIQSIQVLPVTSPSPSLGATSTSTPEGAIVVDSASQKVISDTATVPAKVSAVTPPTDGTKKLFELKSLLDQKLITQKDYDMKKVEILKSM